MRPRVSILLQTYNQAHFLDESVESLLGQTWRDFELRIVDDCSPDETWQVLQKYKDQDRVTLVRNSRNLGQHASTNLHLVDLSGEFVLFASGDDYYYPRFLESLLSMFEKYAGIALCHCNGHVIDGNSRQVELISDWYCRRLASFGVPEAIRALNTQNYVLPGHEFFKYLMLYSNLIASHSTCMVRHASLGLAGSFDEDLPQVGDWDMWLRLCTHGHVGYVSEPLVGWRRHDSSASAEMERTGLATIDGIKLTRKVIDSYPDFLCDLNVQETILYMRQCLWWALEAYSAGETNSARTLIKGVQATQYRYNKDELQFTPLFLDALIHLVRDRFDLPKQETDAVAYLNRLYEDLLLVWCQKPILKQARSHFWVVEAFNACRVEDTTTARSSAFRAILADPSCIRNRGLTKILIRSTFPRLTGKSSP